MAKTTKRPTGYDITFSSELKNEFSSILAAGYRPSTHIGMDPDNQGLVCCLIWFKKTVMVHHLFEVRCTIQCWRSPKRLGPQFSISISGHGTVEEVETHTAEQALERAEALLRENVSATRAHLAALVRDAKAQYASGAAA